MTTQDPPHLFIFGPGYSLKGFMARASAHGWHVSATYRRADTKIWLESKGITPLLFDEQDGFPCFPPPHLPPVTHIASSIAPARADGAYDERLGNDPVLTGKARWIKDQQHLRWMGYLSATTVYGDHQGGWVDENTPTAPHIKRGQRRVTAEQGWLDLAQDCAAPLHIFRLAGIYGPGRNIVKSLLEGTARHIIKEGQIFSRIHVADIEEALWLSANSAAEATRTSLTSEIFNMADDTPMEAHMPVRLAADALGIAPPPPVAFQDADMSAMARSFYSDSKKVSNEKVKKQLGLKLRYPSLASALPDLVNFETHHE